MTMWLSVDPMADKYPSISPYVYCAWNPIKMTDPDGKEFQIPPRVTRPAPSRVGFMSERDKVNRSRERASWGRPQGRNSSMGRPANRCGKSCERLPQSQAEYIITSYSTSDGMNYQYTKDSKLDYALAQLAVEFLQKSKSYREAVENGNYSVGEYSKSYLYSYGYHQEKYKLIQFDDPEVQRIYLNALNAWYYLESEIYRQYGSVLGDKYFLGFEGFKRLSEIGVNPTRQVLSNFYGRPHTLQSRSTQVESIYPSD